MAAGSMNFDGASNTVRKASEGASTAEFPRMTAGDGSACYVCGKNRIPVGRLERSKNDHFPCCAQCAVYILGYVFEEDGHLTRKPPEA